MNAANILKPALSRGEIQVIGATTFTEYRKHIEKDTALERRFQPVTVNEPNLEDTMEILRGVAHYYESYHGVKIPEGILRQAVLLSERYITRPVSAGQGHRPHRRGLLRHEPEGRGYQPPPGGPAGDPGLREGAGGCWRGAEEPNFERLAELKSHELQLQGELDQLTAKGTPELTMDNLARVIELWTKIPASKIREEEFKRLSELDQRLKKKIIGQDEAIDAVAAAIRRNRVGISPKHKPVSFIFVGSTGVGKTELVKQLADDLFNARRASSAWICPSLWRSTPSPGSSAPPRAMWATTRRDSSRRRSAASPTASSSSTRSRRPTPTSSRPAPDPGRRPDHRRPRPEGEL